MPLNEKKIATPQIAERAMLAIRAWERGERQDEDLVCPICDATGLQVVDKSVRPHTAWFELICRRCGLSEAVAIPDAVRRSGREQPPAPNVVAVRRRGQA